MDRSFILLLAIFIPLLSICSALEWGPTNNGYEYVVVEVPYRDRTQYTFYQASDLCMAEGGYLTSITSQAEKDFLRTLIRNTGSDFWVGFNDLDKDGRWEWTDGEEVTYTNWSGKRSEYCIVVNRYVSWNSKNCGSYEGFICKRKIGDTTPKTTPAPPVVPGYCPGGWTDAGTNRCYKIYFSEKPVSWGKARDLCLTIPRFRPDLACANKQSEIDTLTRMTAGKGGERGFLIGLRRTDVYQNSPQSWQWADNSPLEATNFQRYIQADDLGCGYLSNVLDPPGSWDVLGKRCYSIFNYYICQIEKDPNNIISEPPVEVTTAAPDFATCVKNCLG